LSLETFFVANTLLYLTVCPNQCRIQITISLSGRTNTELQAQNIFPLYVMLARPTSNVSLEGVSLAFWVVETSDELLCLSTKWSWFSFMIQFCSILQFIGSAEFVCLLLLVNLEIKTTLKPHSSFLMWRICQPPLLATLTLSLLAVVQCTTYMIIFPLHLCAIIKLFYSKRASRTKYWWRLLLWEPCGELFSPK
jgi:hypothetical protein